jgi:predicted NBD/HSP70 family sugar kinase
MSGTFRKNAVAPRVLAALLVHGEKDLSLADLAQHAGVSKRSMTSVAAELESVRVLARSPARFGSGAGLVLSVSVGSETAHAAMVDVNGAVHASVHAEPDPHQLRGPPSKLVSRIRAVARESLSRAVNDPSLVMDDDAVALLGVTVALPTALDRDGYVHGHTFDDKEWQAVPVVDRVRSVLGGVIGERAYIDAMNDANAAVLAVAFDTARNRAHGPRDPHSEVLMTVRLGGGIGAGTMQLARYAPEADFALNRSRLVVGTSGLAGELGHLPIGRSDVQNINAHRPSGLAPVGDWECSCRQRGHLEGIASVRALIRRLQNSGYPVDPRSAVGPQLTRLLDSPDERIKRALHDTGRLVGGALASPILMLDPKRITLTGYLARKEVAAGVAREQHIWSTGVANNVEVVVLNGEANENVEIRGAAIGLLRRRVHTQLTSLVDADRRSRLMLSVSKADVG